MNKNHFYSPKGVSKKILNVLSWVLLVFLILIAAFLMFYFVSTKVSSKNNKKPTFGLYTILTGSMQPKINPYDVIFDVSPTSPESLKVGDIITFKSDGKLTQGLVITHRIVKIDIKNGEYLYYTKGDYNISQDPTPAKYENILGKVLFTIPQLGRIQEFLSTKGGWLVVVIIPTLIIIITDVLKIIRLKNAKDEILSNSTVNEELENKEDPTKKLKERYVEANRRSELEPLPFEDTSYESFGEDDIEEDVIELPNVKEEKPVITSFVAETINTDAVNSRVVKDKPKRKRHHKKKETKVEVVTNTNNDLNTPKKRKRKHKSNKNKEN